MTPRDPAQRRYFFDQGLHFTCTGCGRCCTGAPGWVRINAEERTALAAHLGCDEVTFVREFTKPLDLPEGGLSLRERADGSCVFFHDNRCTVYHLRPLQCRTYPFWVKNLRSPEAWAAAASQCPGIGQGHLHTRDEILDIVERSPV